MALSHGGGSAFFILLLCCLVGFVHGVQHQVGGAPGWSLPSLANVNYTTWAGTQKFVVGDTLYFNYSKAFHNVLEVSKTNYDGCNAANAIATYDDGATIIHLNKTGSFYFICGIPTHCTQGQKVEIMVTSSVSVPSPSPTSPVSSPSPMSTAPPSGSSATPAGAPVAASGPGGSGKAPAQAPANSANTFKCTLAMGFVVAVSSLMILM